MPELPASFLPGARREAERERRYYERAAGMGGAFVAALDAALARAQAAPEAGSMIEARREHVRAVSLRRFPFRLVYVVRGRVLVVVAIAHKRRRPGYWRRRLA